jgi:hypothetical protein
MRYLRRPASGFTGPARRRQKEEVVSYEIDVTSVRAVLLADGWHRVKARSFGIEPYGYVASPEVSDEKKGNGGNGGKKKTAATVANVAEKGLPPTMGARWTKPNGEVIACPVGSVLALRHARKGKS